VSAEDPSSVEYLVQREEFERKHPSKLTRQPVNMAAWGEPTKARKAAQQQAVRSPFKARSGEEVNPQVDQTSTQESDTVEFQAVYNAIPSEFKIKVNNSQREALEALRANKEKKKGGKY